jgi:acetylornithine/succinyldiaminopimelate/putrescine aminotransferase
MIAPYPSRAQVFESFGNHVSRGKTETYSRYGFDVVMGERSGIAFQDSFDQRPFFNCHCNGGVFNLGHRHPRIIEVLREALESLDIGNHHLISGARARLAEELCATTDGRLEGVVFGVSGGEAIDLAIKVVRATTGRQEILSVSGGYHGHTGLALAAGDPQYRDAFGPNLPSFSQVPFDDLKSLEDALTPETAAVILEPIPATLGMPIAAAGYLKEVENLSRKVGAKLIIDEVQTGLGRTGSFWCHDKHGVDPDVVVTGKGLSGGIYPITATLMKADLHRFFDEHPFIHISTFGGSELGCAVALEVLAIVREEGFLENVREVAAIFKEGFEDLPFELRQDGLMMGLKFPVADAGLMAAKLLFDAGIFAVYANNDTSVLQFLPPLVMTPDEASEVLKIVRRVFG